LEVLTVTLNPALDRETIIPYFEPNRLHRIFEREKMNLSPGGKGINVSVILSEWGIDSVSTGFLGGNIGRMIEYEIHRKYRDITTSFVHINDESRENIAVLDECNHTITEINEAGPTVAEHDVTHFIKVFRSLVDYPKTVLISGSLPYGIPIEMYSTLTRIAHEKNTEVYLEARGALLTYSVNTHCADIVRPDLRSDTRIFGKELETMEDYIEAGEKIIEKGAQMVVSSFEIVNDIVFTKDGIWLLSLCDPHVDPSHLLGSGDTYMAAMMYFARKNGPDLLERAKFGMAAALAKTKYLFKKSPTIEEIEEALPKIQIKKIKG